MRELSPRATAILDIVFAINQLVRGRGNNVGEVTLTASTTTTTVTLNDEIGNSNGKVFLTPTTANAAAELGNGTLYVSSVTNNTFVLTHANNAQNDRTFHYKFAGG